MQEVHLESFFYDISYVIATSEQNENSGLQSDKYSKNMRNKKS